MADFVSSKEVNIHNFIALMAKVIKTSFDHLIFCLLNSNHFDSLARNTSHQSLIIDIHAG
jgi:hypothetical protein